MKQHHPQFALSKTLIDCQMLFIQDSPCLIILNLWLTVLGFFAHHMPYPNHFVEDEQGKRDVSTF